MTELSGSEGKEGEGRRGGEGRGEEGRKKDNCKVGSFKLCKTSMECHVKSDMKCHHINTKHSSHTRFENPDITISLT